MPIASRLVWPAIGVAALFVPARWVGWLAVYSVPVILPLAFRIEKLRGRRPFLKEQNPISTVFLRSIVGIGLLFPRVINDAASVRPADYAAGRGHPFRGDSDLVRAERR